MAEKEDLQLKFNDIRESYIAKDKEHQETINEYDRFLWDMLFSLETAKCKHENNEITKHVAGMDSPLLKKIKEELENPDREKSIDRSDKKAAIIKYIGVLAEIINTYSSKHSELAKKYKDFESIKVDYQTLNKKYEEEKSKFENEKEEIMQSKAEEYELKNQEINDMYTDYQKQVTLIRSELECQKEINLEKDHKLKELNAELAISLNTSQKHVETILNLKTLSSSLILRINDLIFQKQLLTKQYASNKSHSKKLEKFLKRVYFKFREWNLGTKQSDSQDSFENSIDEAEVNPAQSLKFKVKKATFAIIAINRMKMMLRNPNYGYGKYDLDELNDIETREFECQYTNHRDNTESLPSLAKMHNSIETSLSVTPVKHNTDEEYKDYSLENIGIYGQAMSNSKSWNVLSYHNFGKNTKSKKNKMGLIDWMVGKVRPKSSYSSTSYDSTSPFYTALTRQLDLQIKTYFDKVKVVERDNYQ